MDETALSQQPYLTFFSEDTAEYDVIVDQSSSAPNLKEATWGAIQPLLPIIGQQLGPDEMALILEYSPMPESFLEKFKALQDQKAQQPAPPDPEMLKIEAMKQAKAAELQMRQQETQVSIQAEQQKTQAQLELDRQKTAAQLQLEREKAMADLQLEREKAAISLEVERQRMAFEQQKSEQERLFREKTTQDDMQSKLEMARFDAALNFKDDPEKLTEMLHDKKLTAALEQMTQSLTALAQAQMQMLQAQTETNRLVADSVSQMGAELKTALTKPKQIVRGPDGRAIGVQ